MTYLRFHVFFNLPALSLLLWVVRGRLRRAHWKCIVVLCAIVFLATTPWDNWAVHRGFWDFDWRRVTPLAFRFRGVEWRLPAEEYAFFVIETVMVSLFSLLFLPRFSELKEKLPMDLPS